MDTFKKIFGATLLAAGLSGCLGGSGGSANTTSSTTSTTSSPTLAVNTYTATSSASTLSGAIGAYNSNGSTMLLSPAAGGLGQVNFMDLTSLANKGIQTSLGASTVISGTSIDPVHDVGIAFNFYTSTVSFFKPSTAVEISTFDAAVVNGLSYSGASFVKISGVILDANTETAILATADGFKMVSYKDPAKPVLLLTVNSDLVDATNGVTIMENFALDPTSPAGSIIITGGKRSNPMILVESKTGKIYKPDTATAALFSVSDYIDAAAVDTTYHVAILADEGSGITLVDLNKVTLNSAGTYSLPAAAVKSPSAVGWADSYKMDNLGIESTNHYAMLGRGYGGSSVLLAKLQDPKIALDFVQNVKLSMPYMKDNKGSSVWWSGGYDPHASGAYLDASNRSVGIWLSSSGKHVALIDIKAALDGTLAAPASYDPVVMKDIQYIAMP